MSESAGPRDQVSRSLKVEALGRLAGGVAHDFNNLLSIVALNLDALEPLVPSETPASRHLEEISLAVRKATGITRQLLLYSRKKTSERRLVSCHTAVQEARRLTEGLRAGCRFESDLRAELDGVMMEEGQLDQVLLNLVVNARDAVGSGGILSMATENRLLKEGNAEGLPAGNFLHLSVTDNGQGIPQELQEKVFEPYFTTKAVGKGTGLGLSTVSAIVSKAGGHIALTSRPGQTRFEILLPAVPAPTASAAPAKLAPRGTLPSVLLVEDQSAIRAMVHRLLERKGHKVTSVGSSDAALELLRDAAEGFDLLVTDMALPGQPGSEVARAFQRDKPGGRVLFVSGSPDVADADIPSASRFLAKPFTPEGLFSALDQLMAAPV